MTIKDKLATVPQWQQERFLDVLDQLDYIDITDSELQTLLWLCGFEKTSADNVVSLIIKAKMTNKFLLEND